ncbi:hypothetical protein [Actinomadura rupiterrae]|uniref:hypothetical protein n=1 Tax=Actinomadura rupiterrae TaxID=559627 RepID=UPI0020A4E379|nr:hypothetical protein [Actinomadura rupiterrae]MCP2335216.1 hypothetical protein [Actinomadura rupiterrae]
MDLIDTQLDALTEHLAAMSEAVYTHGEELRCDPRRMGELVGKLEETSKAMHELVQAFGGISLTMGDEQARRKVQEHLETAGQALQMARHSTHIAIHFLATAAHEFAQAADHP